MAIELITAPTKEPLTLAEAKLHLGESGTDQDRRITNLIVDARKQVEKLTNRRLITQVIDYHLDKFPTVFRLPVAPVQSVDSITYYDVDGTQQTLASSVYHTDIKKEPGAISLVDGETWEDTEYKRPNAVTVRLTVGYGDDASDVHEGIKTAMLMYIEQMHYRGDEIHYNAVQRAFNSSISQYELPTFYRER